MIRMYGTTENGEGYVMRLGDYDCMEDVTIVAGMFGWDVELTFEEIDEDEDKDYGKGTE
jgi:hypothetical protein